MEQILINLVTGALGGVAVGKSSPTFDLGGAARGDAAGLLQSDTGFVNPGRPFRLECALFLVDFSACRSAFA